MKVSVILPTYNEADGIVSLIKDILDNFKKKPDFEPEILVIDDASPDKTAEITRNQYGGDTRVKVLVRQNEKGLATAIKFGIRNATGEIILFMDADGNHDPKYIPILLDLIKYYEVVMGTRYGWGGGMDASRFRYWGSYFFNIFIKAILRIESSDNTSGYIMVRKNILNGLNLDEIFQGYGEWFFSLLYAFQGRVKDFVEIPIYYPKRRGGESKTNFFHNFFIYASRVFLLRLKKNKLKI